MIAVDIKAIRAALGNAPAAIVVTNAAGVDIKLDCGEYTPTIVDPPCFYPADVSLAYADARNTFNGLPVIEVTLMLLTAPIDMDQEGQALLDQYLSHPGSTSVKAAIEADQTLGGLVKAVFVHDIDSYRLYTVGDKPYYGARFRTLILGG